MLTVDRISYSVAGTKLLDDISLSFTPGKLHLILGPNGAGKSTLIKVVCGQLKPQAGQVSYAGRAVGAIPLAEISRFRAVLSQNIEIAFPLSVREIVMMGRYPHFTGTAAKKDHDACAESMAFFDVDMLADRNYMTLSGGEKQRVHFARIAAQIWYPSESGCRYLILDEPLTFLDVHYQFDFMHKLIKLMQGSEVVIIGVVHDLNLAARFADHITLLHRGRVLASGSKEEVFTASNIKTAYRLDPVIHNDARGMFLFFE